MKTPLSPAPVAIALAAVLIAAKAMLLAKLGTHPLWLLPMVSIADVLFVLALGVLGALTLRAAKGRPRPARAMRAAWLGLALVCAIYAVVSIGIFEYFRRPLTFDMVRLVRGAGAIRSSLSERLTFPIVFGVVAAPALVILGARWISRRHRATVWAVCGGGLWTAAGVWQTAAQPTDFQRRHLARNPHVEFCRSALLALTKSHRAKFPNDFPLGDRRDFEPFATRGATTRHAWEPRPKNVIVIVLESVGTKYLSLYGSHYDTAPCLSAEAAHALVFDEVYAQATYTWSSFIALNFSIYPGMPWHFAGTDRPFPPTLASLLKARGWRTAYLHNGDLDWGSTRWMLNGHGYDIAEGYGEIGGTRLTSWGTEDRCLIDRLIRWIDEKPGGPFFAFCWTDQTHDPYALSPGVAPVDFFFGQAPPAFAADLGRYLNVLRETDRQLGRLFAALRERGVADETLVVITGDHGEAFGDPHEQRGHSLTVFEEEVRVPLMLWNPRLFSPGKRVNGIGGHIDLNATLAELLGVDPPGEWQGHSLFDPARPRRAYFMAHSAEYLFGVREARWKYIFDASGGGEMLFDLARDPREQQDVAAAEPARCQRLRQRIAAWVSFEEDFLRARRD